jgi:hypothetical protein
VIDFGLLLRRSSEPSSEHSPLLASDGLGVLVPTDALVELEHPQSWLISLTLCWLFLNNPTHEPQCVTARPQCALDELGTDRRLLICPLLEDDVAGLLLRREE